MDRCSVLPPEGWVVCEEFVDTLKSAWEEAQSAKAERQREKKSKRALDNWKLLVRSVQTGGDHIPKSGIKF